jgi:hypothetical protein
MIFQTTIRSHTYIHTQTHKSTTVIDDDDDDDDGMLMFLIIFFKKVDEENNQRESLEGPCSRLPGPGHPSPDLLPPQPLPHPLNRLHHHHANEHEGPLWPRGRTNHEVTRRGRARLRDGVDKRRVVVIIDDGHRGIDRRSCRGRGNDNGGGGGGDGDDERVDGGCGCGCCCCCCCCCWRNKTLGDRARGDQGDGSQEKGEKKCEKMHFYCDPCQWLTKKRWHR